MTAPAWRAWWCRLLDGAHVWGTFDAMVGRYGLRRYRLVIFPPGIASADRRLLRLYRGWPVAGGIFFMLAAMLLGDTVSSPWTTLLVAAAGYGIVGGVLFALTASSRASVRSMSLIVFAGEMDPAERQRFDQWAMLVELLSRADQMLSTGTINPAQHEALWWQAYDHLDVPAHV